MHKPGEQLFTAARINDRSKGLDGHSFVAKKKKTRQQKLPDFGFRGSRIWKAIEHTTGNLSFFPYVSFFAFRLSRASNR
jgi:hypothetical protein